MAPRRALMVAFTQILAVVITLVASEGIVRALGIAPVVHRLKTDDAKTAYTISENPKLGYELKKNYRGNPPLETVGGQRMTSAHGDFAYTNAHGFRDVERTLEKPAGKRRYLMLGDSIVAGHGIYDLNDTLSRQLEKLLGHGGEVLNFGIGGYCTAGEVELLETKGLAYAPDEVILVFFVNDYTPYNTQIGGYSFRRPAWAEKLFLSSDLFRLTALKLDLFHFQEQVDPNYGERWHRKGLEHGYVKDALVRLKGLAERAGFTPTIVLWPTFSDRDANYQHHPPGRAEGELEVEHYARELGLPVHRLAPFFEEDHRTRGRGNWVKLYTVGDGAHPSPVGAAVGARGIYKIVRGDSAF